jgi:hypothetical protein
MVSAEVQTVVGRRAGEVLAVLPDFDELEARSILVRLRLRVRQRLQLRLCETLTVYVQGADQVMEMLAGWIDLTAPQATAGESAGGAVAGTEATGTSDETGQDLAAPTN